MISKKRAKQARRYMNKVMERHMLTTTRNREAHNAYKRFIQDTMEILDLYIETCPAITNLEGSEGAAEQDG